MTKSKKYILAIGTAATVVAPLATVVACAGNGGSQGNSEIDLGPLTYVTQGQQSLTLPQTKTALASLITDAKAAGLSEVDVKAITPIILHKVAIGDTAKFTDAEKIAAANLAKLNDVLQAWAFKNNSDKTKMTALNTWVQNAGLSAFSSTSRRGPVKSDSSQGAIRYYRHDLITMPRLLGGAGYDLLNSRLTQGTNRTLLDYNQLGSLKQGDRRFDLNVATGNAFSNYTGGASSFTIFRGKQTGKDSYHANKVTGKIEFDTKTASQYDLFGGLDVKVGSGANLAGDKRTIAGLKEALTSSSGADTIEFSTKGTVNYAQSSNKNVINTNAKFEAKDLFYGFIRSIYGSKTFRTEGKVGADVLTGSFPKMTPTELSAFNANFANEKAADALDNPNLYLLNLYGVDLPATITANKATTDMSKFIVKFKTGKLSATSLVLFQDNTLFNPFSNTLLADQSNKNTLSATNLKVNTYGNSYSGSGTINTDGIYTLAPFVYTEYSTTPTEAMVLSKNPFYADTTWVNNDKTLLKQKTVVVSTGSNPEAKAQQRQVSFKNAKATGEYVLDGRVDSHKSLMEGLEGYKVISSLTENGGAMSKWLFWNYFGYKHENVFNDKGLKMMWGSSDRTGLDSSKDAMDVFFNGDGALVRDSIKAAVNWTAMIKTMNPAGGKVFYPQLSLPNDYVTSLGAGAEPIQPSYLDSAADMETMYESNHQDKLKAWSTSKAPTSAKTLDDIATKHGATAESPAIIPIFRYLFNDQPASSTEKLANAVILRKLNELTPKVHFIHQTLIADWADFLVKANKEYTAATSINSFGPDYKGLGSILSQYLKPHMTGGIVGLFTYLLKS